MGLSTIFLPIHRVERVNKDETVGSVPSLADTFEQRVGKDVWSFLGLLRGLSAGAVDADAEASPWMTLRDAERDYVERVLEDCEWDRNEAARVLGLTVEALESKIRASGEP